MYDARMEAHEFVADERAAAVQKACDFFGTEEDDLQIAELEAAEVYGAAGRVVIVAVPREHAGQHGGGGRGTHAREARDDREAREERGPRRPRGRERERDRDRDRGRGRDRGARNGRDRGDRGGPSKARGDREEREEREPRGERFEPEEPTEPSVGTAVGELGEFGGFVLGVVERMDLGPFEVSENEEAGVIVIQVKGPAAEQLARGEGRTVDALQLIVNQAAVRAGGEERQRVVLDVEGDTDSREAFLSSLAQRVAKRALSSGRAVALDPMNPKDRRAIHLALRDEDGIATMSIGEGRYRQVVVVPEGAPEYEEARRESQAANQSD